MADPQFASQPNPPFFVIFLDGQNSFPVLPDGFFPTHLEDQQEFRKLKLTSDASDRTWEVKLNGRRFSGGWEDFCAAHCLRDDDMLVFRHCGGVAFHVSPCGRKFSQIPSVNSSSGGDDATEDGSEDEDDENEISESEKSSSEAEFPSSENYCLIGVTASNLRLNRVCLVKRFSRRNGLNKGLCEIDLMNQSGTSWSLDLRHNKVTGQDYISGGWTSFCLANELKTGSFYRFEFVRKGRRPLLRLCSKANGKDKVLEKSRGECSKSASMKQNKFMTITLKPYMFESGQLHLGRPFVRANGIESASEIALVNKDGVNWLSNARGNRQGGFYLSKGWRGFCVANGLKIGDTFSLEFVCGEGSNPPMLKLSSKAKNQIEEGQEEMETLTRAQKRSRSVTPFDSYEVKEEGQDETVTLTRVQKKARSYQTRARVGQGTVKRKQPLPLCSITDQLAEAKQSIVEALTSVKQYRCDLKIMVHNLKVSLPKIDVLEKKIMEINNIFNN